MNRAQRRENDIYMPHIMLIGEYLDWRPYAYGWVKSKARMRRTSTDGLILLYPETKRDKQEQISELLEKGHIVFLDEDKARELEIQAKKDVAKAFPY